MWGCYGLSCKKSARTTPTHMAINKIIPHPSTEGFPNILEPPGLSRNDGNGGRPDGKTIILWEHGNMGRNCG